jgi:ribosome-binding protein aMBF1 (putative translation factor)
MSFKNEVKIAMLNKGISNFGELAEKLEIDKPWMSLIVNCHKELNIKIAKKMSEVLDIDLATLIKLRYDDLHRE